MAVNSDYLEPTRREEELQRAAKLLRYVYQELGRPVPNEVERAAEDIYCSVDFVPTLCSTLKQLNSRTRNSIVYHQTRTARDLANWWEDHLAADAEREKKEKEQKHRQRLVASALKKLTLEERK